MKLTRIGYAGGPTSTIHTTLQDLEPGRLTPIILVPDEQTLHEVKGLVLLLNKEASVEVLEPGKELPWSSYLYFSWCVNTDKYTLTFGITNELQTPHLVYAPSYLTAYKD